MLAAAAEEAGCDAEQLDGLIRASESSKLQTGLAMNAAQRTAWPPKVRALGRVLAEGLLASDEAEVDVQQQALVAMADLERLHLVLLELLVKYEPRWFVGGPAIELHSLPSYRDSYMREPGTADAEVIKEWNVAPARKWATGQILEVRPQLRPILTTLLGTLQRHGLAAENNNTPQALNQLSKEIVKLVNNQAQNRNNGQLIRPSTLNSTAVRGARSNWSPTELGEEDLGLLPGGRRGSTVRRPNTVDAQ